MTPPPPADPPPGREKADDWTVPPVPRPGRDDLLRRMRRVDPDLAHRYRQRNGE
ncbi:MAG: ubiquitin-like protein UBact [Armatimonadetes bacterium]|nr:ubiquitin-like protein UBact [Armatimonadota bacterium]